MAKWTLVVISALVSCIVAEPPSGYSYSAPSSSYVVLGGGGGGGHGGSGLSSGGHYTSVPVGYQTSEGYHVDQHLLEKIKHIILKDEIQNQGNQGYSSHGGHGISSQYGAPAPVYGVPSNRVVGIELGHIQQGVQVAQYHQQDEGYSGGYAGGYSGGYSDGGYSSGGIISSGGYSSGLGGFSSGHGASISYSAPSVSYNTIGAPSGSYGVPSVSSSYGTPSHH